MPSQFDAEPWQYQRTLLDEMASEVEAENEARKAEREGSSSSGNETTQRFDLGGDLGATPFGR